VVVIVEGVETTATIEEIKLKLNVT
jgi:hypothetical protein